MIEFFPTIGVNVFLVREGKILLGKRIGKVGFGTWCLPGGKLEFGESLTEGAKRELFEETGIVAEKLKFLHLVNEPEIDKNTHWIHIDFLAADWKGEPSVTEPDKFAEWRWFDFKNLPDEIFIGHQKLIPAFLNKVVFQDSTKKEV